MCISTNEAILKRATPRNPPRVRPAAAYSLLPAVVPLHSGHITNKTRGIWAKYHAVNHPQLPTLENVSHTIWNDLYSTSLFLSQFSS